MKIKNMKERGANNKLKILINEQQFKILANNLLIEQDKNRIKTIQLIKVEK